MPAPAPGLQHGPPVLSVRWIPLAAENPAAWQPSAQRTNNFSSPSPGVGSSAFPRDRGQGRAHAEWAGSSAGPAGRGAHPLSLRDGRAAARSGQAGAGCGESCTGRGGASRLHAARGGSVWTSATRGQFALRASARGCLELSGRGQGPTSSEDSPYPTATEGSQARAQNVRSGEKQQPSLPARWPGVAKACGESGHGPGAQNGDCPAALL